MSATSVETCYFGEGDELLFGALHRPASNARVDLALVVCNPFGFEEVCAHRSLRDLALAAAAAGIATLRFDYAGCGQSSGGDEGEMTTRWLGSVHRAIDAVRRATGASAVCLLGVRLGALLAAVAAAERDDVHGLVLVAPVVQGRTYLRELRVLGSTGAAHTAPSDERRLESAGFSLSAATRETLSGLDLKALARAPAPRVVLVERDDLPGTGDLAPVLEQLGAQASVQRWPGYAAMADDAQRSVTPQAIVEGVLATLREWRRDVPAAPAPGVPWGEPTLTGATGWTETPVQIDSGAATPLFGVMCRPPGEAPRAGSAPAMLMLNAGSVHSIGPNRLWVRLSRHWAGRGIRSLRLDLSGIGDSPARPGAADNIVYSPHAMADVAAALAYLRVHEGADACHVMGLCSGAYHAFKAATTGLPVSSALMINPLTYFWASGTPLTGVQDYELVEFAARSRSEAFAAEPWRRLFKGDLDLRVLVTVTRRSVLRGLQLRWQAMARWLRLPLEDDLARELRQAAAGAVPLRFVFAVDAPGFTMLRQQSGDTLSKLLRAGAVSIDFVADADHTFTRAEARERLVRVLDRSVATACGLNPRA